MYKLFHFKVGRLLAVTVMLTLVLTACGEAATSTTAPTPNATINQIIGNAPTPAAATKLPNSTLPTVKSGKAKLVGPIDGTTPVTFSIQLKLSQAQATNLQNLVGTVSNPKDKNGQPINNDQFVQTYAPSQDQVNAIKAYMQANGIELVSVSEDRLSATFKAPAALLQKTFNVKINNYQETRTVKSQVQNNGGATPDPSQDGQPNQTPPSGSKYTPGAKPVSGQSQTVDFYANDQDVSVPSNYLPYIESITLNNYPIPDKVGGLAMMSGFTGYSPASLKIAYNINALGMDGSGQTIAIVASGGFKPSDIENYAKTFKLPTPQIETILVDGANGKPTSDAVEVTLDIEVAIAIAPKAKILVYEVPKLNDRTKIDLVSKIVSDGRSKIINISYGLCELAKEESAVKAFHTLLAKARAQGITIFVAAGDDGAYDCAQVDNSIANQLAVDYPASDSYTTAVGGTALIVQNGKYTGEVAWGEPSDPSGGGGGVSSFFALPKFQQSYLIQDANQQNARQLPDVSADADSYTGYAIYCTTGTDGCKGWEAIGGTSAATPLWAAATALVDQYLATKFNDPKALLIGPEYLYLLQDAYTNNAVTAAPYRDVTKGDNLYYPAGDGYDLATGLGTPDFKNIATDMEQLFSAAGYS